MESFPLHCIMPRAAAAFLCGALSAGAAPRDATALPSMDLAAGATAHTGVFRGSDGSVAPDVAYAQVTWGPDALEIRVSRELKPGQRLKVQGDPKEPQTIFRGATMEVFFAPHPDSPDVFYQIGVNPSNAVYMAKRFDTSWRPARPITTRATVAADSWCADFTIPFGAFGERPVATGTVWKAEFSCGGLDWAGVGSRHDVSQYGEIRFGARCERAHVERVTRDQDGTLHVTYSVAPPRAVGEIPHKNARGYDLTLVSGGERLAGFSASSGNGDASYLTLDRYYYPAAEPTRLEYAAKGFGASKASVRRIDTGETVCSASGGGQGTLACGLLAPGEYAFEISDGVGRASCEFEVVAESPGLPRGTDGSMRIAEWNPRVLTADFGAEMSRPFYPITGSQAFSGSISFRRAYPNRVVPKPREGYLFDTSRPLYGADAILGRGPGAGLVLNRLAYEAQLAVLTQDGPNGETEIAPSQAAFYQSSYRELKVKYPNLLFSIHIDASNGSREFAAACDVFEQANWSCSYAANPLRTIESALDSLLRDAPKKPVLFWLGASIPKRGIFRTADELNTAVRYCILRGVSGNVFHMGHGGVPKSRTRLWSCILGCERSVNAWYPAWARGQKADAEIVCEDGVCADARVGGGSFVLVAANLSPFERSFSYRDPALGRRSVRLTGCGSVVITR